MYVCVIVDKLNHCTAFKLKCSPWDNKYTHADIQVRYSDSLRAHRDSLCVPVEEELRFQGLRIRKLLRRDQRGGTAPRDARRLRSPACWRFRWCTKKKQQTNKQTKKPKNKNKTLTTASQPFKHVIQELSSHRNSTRNYKSLQCVWASTKTSLIF